MRARLLVQLIVTGSLCAGASASVFDLGNSPPDPATKVPVHERQTRARVRQGGDTTADAFVITAIPFTDTGTTLGYSNDYDAICPYSGSTAPDVVYKFQLSSRVDIDIDMCGSGYDTKIYLMDAYGNILACNDDFYFGAPCGVYVSKIEHVAVASGQTVYLVIDGYGTAAGDYDLAITAYEECYVPYPQYAQDESEPYLHDNYADEYNSGCNSESGSEPFQWLYGGESVTIYGRSGWYYYQGSQRRDTDWFLGDCGPTGQIGIEIVSEFPATFFRLGDYWDCFYVDVLQSATLVPCQPVSLDLPVGAYNQFCIWVGPTSYQAPDGFIGYQFNYVLYVDGLEQNVVTEAATWGTVKSLFR